MFLEIRFGAPNVDSVSFKMFSREQVPSLNKMTNGKMKGLLKGLRYISHIFESEKEPKMQIGHPTDVKHVAHIGWEGPSVNSPSWMNEFSSKPVLSSSSLTAGDSVEEGSAREDSGRRGLRSPKFPGDQPKMSMRQTSSGIAVESPTKDKSEKSKSRRSSRAKDSTNNTSNKTSRKPMDPNQGIDSPTFKLSSTPKKSRRKKSKDSSSVGGSARSRSRAQTLETG